MKKYILSFLVISTFAVYGVYLRVSGPQDLAVVSSSDSSLVEETPKGSLTAVDSPQKTPAVSTPPIATPIPSSPSVVPVKTPKPIPTSTPSVTPPVKVVNTGLYKDGEYTGISANAYYGNIQVVATISGGKLTDVAFLDYPQDRSTSRRINMRAMPYLRQEAIQAQSANVNTVSGASDSSGAFRRSLASALAQAKNT